MKPPVCLLKSGEQPLTVGIVLAFGPVDFPLPVDAKEELLVGEEFSPAHVSLEVVVAAPRVAPHRRCRRRVGRPGQPGGGGVQRWSMRWMRGEGVRRRPARSMASVPGPYGCGRQGRRRAGSEQEEEDDEGEGAEA